MKLSAPKQISWLIALILGILGIVFQFFVPTLQMYGFWAVLVALILMLLATFLEGL